MLLSYPPQWWLYYRQENEVNFKKISVTQSQLISFLETYGYETNDLTLLKQFGVNTINIKQNNNLKLNIFIHWFQFQFQFLFLH
jgi:hypothetical protein